MKTNNEIKEPNNLDQLLVKLKKEDSNYANISKAITIVYWIFIPLFIILTIIEYVELHNIQVFISGSGFVIAFLIFALFFRKYYKEYKYVDYSLPTLLMLKKAAWRYKPFQLRSFWILLAILFMDVALTFNWGIRSSISVFHTQIVIGSALMIGIVVGLILWFIKYKPIRDEALQLIKEIEGE